MKYIVLDNTNTNNLLAANNINFPSYTVATLPDATTKTNEVIWVSDAVTSGSTWNNDKLGSLCISDGIQWLTVVDAIPVSNANYYRTITTDTTLNSNNRQVEVNAQCVVTLPSAQNCLLGLMFIKNATNSYITINPAASQNIDGYTSITLSGKGSLTLMARNNTTWYIV